MQPRVLQVRRLVIGEAGRANEIFPDRRRVGWPTV